MQRRCRVMQEAHSFSHLLSALVHLTACCTEQNATIIFSLTIDDSRQIFYSTHTKPFLWGVSTIIYSLRRNWRAFPFCIYSRQHSTVRDYTDKEGDIKVQCNHPGLHHWSWRECVVVFPFNWDLFITRKGCSYRHFNVRTTSMCSTTGPLSTNIVKRKMTVPLLLLLMVKSMAMMIKMMTMVITLDVYFEYFHSDGICIHADVVRCKLLCDVIKMCQIWFQETSCEIVVLVNITRSIWVIYEYTSIEVNVINCVGSLCYCKTT